MPSAFRVRFAGGAFGMTDKTLTLNAVARAVSGDGAFLIDRNHFGYSASAIGGSPLGSLSSTSLGAYTIVTIRETVDFTSVNGSFTGASDRDVFLEVSGGPAPLVQGDLTSLDLPSGPALLGASATNFTPSADGGLWAWDVTTNAAGASSADYCTSGTVTIDVP